MIATSLILAVSLLCYQFLLFSFSDQVLVRVRIKKRFRIFFYLCNVYLAYFLTASDTVLDAQAYVVIFAVLFAEMLFFYNESPLLLFFLSSSVVLHIMCARSICIAIFSLHSKTSVYAIVKDDFLVILTMILTINLLSLLLYLIKKLIPVRELKIISKNTELLLLLSFWVSVFNLYMYLNALVYTDPGYHPRLAANQLTAPFSILCGFYVVVFVVIKTISLLMYKEKNKSLEHDMECVKQYRASMTSDALMIYEINLTKDCIITGFDRWMESGKNPIKKYSEVIVEFANQKVFSDDIRFFLQQNSVLFLLAEFDSGKQTVACEYRYRFSESNYVWVRALTSLMRDIQTGEIKSFTFVRDIDREKKRQIELQYKAERDSLTGLYNKEVTGKLIAEHLQYNMRNAGGALFVIDIDNFKSINDNLGHVTGDAILCEISEKIRISFRGDDIVGRIGGDEFIVFMKNAGDCSIIQLKAQEVNQLCLIYFSGKNDERHTVSCSMGIALFPSDGGGFQELYKNADIALYAAKKRGKNSYSFFSRL